MDQAAREQDPGGARCPWCGAVSRRRYFPFVVGYESKGSREAAAWWGIGREAEGLAMSFCQACRKPVLWHEGTQIWPTSTSAPPPAPAMPAEVRASYDEARAIVDGSPRSAAALLRLSLQTLVVLLVRPGGSLPDDVQAPAEPGPHDFRAPPEPGSEANMPAPAGPGLDADVRALAESGLPDAARHAFRAARVVGHDAVRPGRLDPRDDRQTALALFDLVNVVVEKMIAEPATWRR